MFQMEYRVRFFFIFGFSILLSNFKLSKWFKTVMLWSLKIQVIPHICLFRFITNCFGVKCKFMFFSLILNFQKILKYSKCSKIFSCYHCQHTWSPNFVSFATSLTNSEISANICFFYLLSIGNIAAKFEATPCSYRYSPDKIVRRQPLDITITKKWFPKNKNKLLLRDICFPFSRNYDIGNLF